MKLVASDGVPILESRKIAKSLHLASQKFAESGEVCSFQIIQMLQESLQYLNEHHQSVDKPESLWEEMQMRQKNEFTSKSQHSDHVDFQFVHEDIFEDDVHTTSRAEPLNDKDAMKSVHSHTINPKDTIVAENIEEGLLSSACNSSSIEVSESGRSSISSAFTESRSFSSLMNSFSSFRHNIPDMVRHLLDRTKTQIEKTHDKSGADKLVDESLAGIQRDLLLGRLLFDQKDSSTYPKDVLSALELGLIPNWLGNLLLKHHEAFKVAFKRVFARQLASLEANSSQNDLFDEPLHLIQYFSDFEKKYTVGNQDAESRGKSQGSTSNSRYNTDFTEIKVLGRGGYGKVFLTLHKFDGRNYAVKRVNLHSSDDEFEKIMREVQTLSRMQHQHVVRYYAAWLETALCRENESSSDDGMFADDSVSYSETWTISNTLEQDAECSEDYLIEKQFLYIQMEYCQSTLRKMLDDGLLDDDELKWKIVRQLLSGLSYVHQKGVIHRDLKPANIFVDSLGDVKLGDFGLAKDLSGHEVENKAEHETVGRRSKDRDTHGTTGVCGTGFYIAPEIELAKQYDEKVDIFSLGIVIFELWKSFDTEMERFVTLKDLRETGKLPKDFLDDHPDVGKLVSWLLSRDPLSRPTAHEALKSPLIPSTFGDEHFTDLLRSLPDNPSARDKMISELFKMQSNIPLKLKACEEPGAPDVALNIQLDRRGKIIDTMSTIFKRSGAVEMTSKFVGTSSLVSPTAVRAMTVDGQFISLRDEVRQRFVDWAVSSVEKEEVFNIHEGFKRFEISTVFRNSAYPASPKAFMMVDLDYLLPPLSPGKGNIPLGEAELIAVVCEAIANIEHMNDSWEVRISHSSLFHALMTRFSLPKELQQSVYKHLRASAISVSPLDTAARQIKWNTIGKELNSLGVPPDALSKIKEIFVLCTGDFQSVMHKVNVFINPKRSKVTAQPLHQGQIWLEELTTVYSFLNIFGVPNGKISLDPFVSPQEYFSGILFEVHSLDQNDGSSMMLAAGGRFDSLIKASWASKMTTYGDKCPTEPTFGGFGVTINMGRLVSLGSFNHSLPLSSADVLVCSKGSGSSAASSNITGRTLLRIQEKVRILTLLRDAGIRADIMPSVSPSMTDQFAYASSRGIPYLVIFDVEDLQMNNTVKIKQVRGKFEEDQALENVAKVLQQLLMPHGNHHGQMIRSLSTEDFHEPSGDLDSPARFKETRRYAKWR